MSLAVVPLASAIWRSAPSVFGRPALMHRRAQRSAGGGAAGASSAARNAAATSSSAEDWPLERSGSFLEACLCMFLIMGVCSILAGALVLWTFASASPVPISPASQPSTPAPGQSLSQQQQQQQQAQGATAASAAETAGASASMRPSSAAHLRNRLEPFPGADPVETVAQDRDYMQQMLWGSYDPQLYFSLRTRTPRAVHAGLMWYRPGATDLRHGCNHDEVGRFGWRRHDGRTFGHQIIDDGPLQLQTDFVKHVGPQSVHGGGWVARVSGRSRMDASAAPLNVSVVFYVTTEEGDLQHRRGVLTGTHSVLGTYALVFPRVSGVGSAAGPASSSFAGLYLASHHGAKDALRDLLLAHQMRLPNSTRDGAVNTFMYHYTLQTPFELDLVLLPHDEHGGKRLAPAAAVAAAVPFTGPAFSRALQDRLAAFESRFSRTFPFVAPPASLQDGPGAQAAGEFARYALSNMVGGMGYWFGSSLVHLPPPPPPPHAPPSPPPPSTHSYFPRPLFSAVPSRSFFPRGFLWDEGFHQLLIGAWDRELRRDALAHWLGLMNHNGWIPREQILDEAARSKVPPEFVPQNPEVANPPSLLLVVERMLDEADPRDLALLDVLQPRLLAWVHWLNSTQAGSLPNTYFWRGRRSQSDHLNPLTLASGLDDYPRALLPSHDERHVDLQAWMVLAHRVLARVARHAGDGEQARRCEGAVVALQQAMMEYNWDAQAAAFADYGRDARAELVLERVQQRDGRIDEYERLSLLERPTLRFVHHDGYVALFPFLLDVLPSEVDAPLAAALDTVREPGRLRSPHGLRSLGPTSPHFQRHNTRSSAPYWRGAIWINANYLALRELYRLAHGRGPRAAEARELYTALRADLLTNMVRQFERTGFVWEQYDERTGAGQGTHPFTGWSALAVLVMAERY